MFELTCLPTAHGYRYLVMQGLCRNSEGSLMSANETLLTPGPTHIPPQVFEAMHQPKLHHRTDAFKKFLVEARTGVQKLTRSETTPIFLAGSGTAAMESALVNTCQAGDKIVVINVGKFGERWSLIAERLGIKCTEIKAELGKSISIEELKSSLKEVPDAKALCLQYCESSTAVQLAVPELCKVARELCPKILTIVDAISAIGTTPIYVKEQEIDILVAAAHKGLMLPSGLSILIANDRAWKAIENNRCKSLYFDLLIERKASSKDTTSWTPAIQHICGLTASLKMINEEGEEKVYQRHNLLSRATRAAFQTLNLNVFAAENPSPGLSAILLKVGTDAEKVRSDMLKNYSVRVAGGQDELKGRIIRFGHMGYCSKNDIILGIAALEKALGNQAPDNDLPGVKAAKSILEKAI